jgi:hypothetical protein
MKRKSQSACVEDVDPQTEEPILGTQSSASISPPAHESHLRRKIWRKSGQHLYECRDSEDLGLVLDVISKTDQEILTVIAGEHEDNKEVWEECQRASRESGKKLRVFNLPGMVFQASTLVINMTQYTNVTCKDTIINGESKTYIARSIPISAAHDLSATHPSLIIGQRRLSATTGSVTLRAYKLSFGASQIDLDRPYIFSQLGDEMAGLGCPDLHITFRSVRDWDSVLRRGAFEGFDRDVTVPVSWADVRGAKTVVWDFERDCRVEEGDAKPGFGVAVEVGGLWGEEGGKRDPALLSGERRELCVKLIGVGPEIPGHSFRADINLAFVLKS